jgi:hypothetical protein
MLRKEPRSSQAVQLRIADGRLKQGLDAMSEKFKASASRSMSMQEKAKQSNKAF